MSGNDQGDADSFNRAFEAFVDSVENSWKDGKGRRIKWRDFSEEMAPVKKLVKLMERKNLCLDVSVSYDGFLLHSEPKIEQLREFLKTHGSVLLQGERAADHSSAPRGAAEPASNDEGLLQNVVKEYRRSKRFRERLRELVATDGADLQRGKRRKSVLSATVRTKAQIDAELHEATMSHRNRSISKQIEDAFHFDPEDGTISLKEHKPSSETLFDIIRASITSRNKGSQATSSFRARLFTELILSCRTKGQVRRGLATWLPVLRQVRDAPSVTTQTLSYLGLGPCPKTQSRLTNEVLQKSVQQAARQFAARGDLSAYLEQFRDSGRKEGHNEIREIKERILQKPQNVEKAVAYVHAFLRIPMGTTSFSELQSSFEREPEFTVSSIATISWVMKGWKSLRTVAENFRKYSRRIRDGSQFPEEAMRKIFKQLTRAELLEVAAIHGLAIGPNQDEDDALQGRLSEFIMKQHCTGTGDPVVDAGGWPLFLLKSKEGKALRSLKKEQLLELAARENMPQQSPVTKAAIVYRILQCRTRRNSP
eukprot:scaffold3870_cov246-Pinguiococcus_pyrenoidosus.AAC.23